MKDIDEILNKMGENTSEIKDTDMSQNEMDRIYQSTIKKIDKEKLVYLNKSKNDSNRLPKNVIKKLLVASIAATLVTGTVAFGAMHWNDKFVRFFGLSGVEDQHQAASMEVNKSDEDNDVTVSTEQVIGDNQGFYLLLKVKGANQDNALADSFKNVDVKIEDADTYQVSDLECMGIDNGVASYILNVTTPEQLIGKNITLTLKDYGYDGEDKYVTVNKGTWKLSWKLDYEVNTTKYSVNQKINIYGGTANFDSVVLSPLSVMVKYSDTKGCQEIMKNGEDPNDKLIVNFMDGSAVNSDYDKELVYGDNEITIYMNKIVNPDEIESVSFAGITVPITKNPNPIEYVHKDVSDMGYTIDMQKDLNEITRTKEEDYYDKGLKAKGKEMVYTGTIDGAKMDMFHIIMLKDDISEDELAKKASELTYLGYKNGYVYAILYGEVIPEKQEKKFIKILNKDVANIKSRITIYGVKNYKAD